MNFGIGRFCHLYMVLGPLVIVSVYLYMFPTVTFVMSRSVPSLCLFFFLVTHNINTILIGDFYSHVSCVFLDS